MKDKALPMEYPFPPMNPGEAVESQPHGGILNYEANEETGGGLEADEDGVRDAGAGRYTDHHNPNLHNRRSLITENEGDHIRDATPEDGVAFCIPMRADIEES